MGLSESEHPTYTDAVLLLLTKDEILKYDLCPADIPLAEYVKEMK